MSAITDPRADLVAILGLASAFCALSAASIAAAFEACEAFKSAAFFSACAASSLAFAPSNCCAAIKVLSISSSCFLLSSAKASPVSNNFALVASSSVLKSCSLSRIALAFCSAVPFISAS